MYYVYLLKNPKSDQIYIGYTGDLRRRYAEHQKLERHKGWRLKYYEAYSNREDAMERERKLKSYGSSLHGLKARIRRSLDDFQDLEWAG
jgi:putative endonuclease